MPGPHARIFAIPINARPLPMPVFKRVARLKDMEDKEFYINNTVPGISLGIYAPTA